MAPIPKHDETLYRLVVESNGQPTALRVFKEATGMSQHGVRKALERMESAQRIRIEQRPVAGRGHYSRYHAL
jgi:MarR-like DNA-binding transcriptional regulator SgrR of sgrS sRNA